MNKFCQSCGMPMKKDPHNGGTNADGSKSTEYCSYCYQDGVFTSPEIDTPQKNAGILHRKDEREGNAWIRCLDFHQKHSRAETLERS